MKMKYDSVNLYRQIIEIKKIEDDAKKKNHSENLNCKFVHHATHPLHFIHYFSNT